MIEYSKMNFTLDDLYEWVQKDPQRRHASIDIGSADPAERGLVKVWVYDYKLKEGAHVEDYATLDDIDLYAKARQSLIESQKRIEKLLQAEQEQAKEDSK